MSSTTTTASPLPAALTVSASLTQLLQDARALLGRDQHAAGLILDRASRLLAPPPPPPPVTPGGLAGWQVARLTRHVEASLGGPILQKDLAAVARLSTGHFARAFKQSFGITAHAYVMQQRMARARRLMLETEAPLSQVALLCGMADQPHFSRVFRRMEGSTPMAWRRLQRAAAR
ncbi:helix-turn-helix transcriptional regulator [Roseomonas sp. 18066]|uniref:helix-turn-helix transcriptional regulator n=1 Tax=Roseomonas sp. 18066 TaxID=2681412 RepID=UPI00135BD5A5|nr:AraC family transcriptional regulator [Roseomonas sp. 18066]